LLRSGLARPGPVWVGQRVAITVELLTTTFFASAPVFQLPTIAQAILMQIEDHPVLGTEQIDGTTYNVQKHELALFVLQPGGREVPPFPVRFATAPHFGEPPVEYRLMTQALRVEVQPPPGAEQLPGLIATRELHATQIWQPEPGRARPGDAFIRTVTVTAPDVPGMVLPPLPLTRVEGLAVYPQPPVVQDHVERGAFTGERMQTVTYVCERPGVVTLPALRLPWWDVERQKLLQVTLPAVTLEVVAPRRWLSWWVAGAGVVLAVVIGVCWSKRRTFLAVWERRQARQQVSEAGYFARLQHACRADNALAAYNALFRWLDATYRGSDSATLADDLLTRHADADLQRQVAVLQEAALRRDTDWDGAGLAAALHRVRGERPRPGATAAPARLPALNPQ
jgi:hypothetical protein